ncbi:MAG: type VI secretion system tip protein TssI/VgrG [Polyangiaceae bacterium]
MATPSLPSARLLQATIATGDALDVRHFSVSERMNGDFEISLQVRCENPDIDLEGAVGQPGRFQVRGGLGPRQDRLFTGVVSHLQQVAVEDRGLSTYQLVLVPNLWFLTQRRNYRMFQHLSELEIVKKLLGEWDIQFEERITGEYKKRKYRVQYGESDHAFVSRMLEDVGISFFFETKDEETVMILSDAPEAAELRQPPIAYHENPTDWDLEHFTQVRVGRRVRPGKYTVRDHDYRRPASYKLLTTHSDAIGKEEKLERFHYVPGGFLFESDKGEATPAADDKGKYRTSEGIGGDIAKKRLDAKRAIAKTITFDTNTLDPAPGVVLSFLDHPKSELQPGKRLLVLSSHITGSHDGQWTHSCEAVSADSPYRPPLVTPKPRVSGVESATVVGPAGEEIHTDEFGRVRVHFHWDRESKMDDNSSCWIHVSQPWGGTGFGGTNLPRIGQEVIVDFLGGDPDRPIIVGRVYTNLQKTPYKLPDNKTQSGWQSRSSPAGGADNYNEIMLEDKKGQELFRMQAEKDLHKLVKNDEQVNIGRDLKHDVGNNRDRTVGNDETVGIGNNRTKTIGANEAVAIGVNQLMQIGANQATQIGNSQSIDVGKQLKINVGEVIEITCGKSVLRMDKNGNVSINGKNFDFSASDHVQVSSELIDLN